MALQTSTSIDGFLRHVHACNNAAIPGRHLPFRIGPAASGGVQVGWVLPSFRDALTRFPEISSDHDGGVTLTEPGAIQQIARALADEGLLRWRGEAFDIRAEPESPVLAVIDRGAVPAFGVTAIGVHVNGLVRREEVHVWIGWRSRAKTLDPGKIDHITAGGVPAGMTIMETLIKEAEEEASMPRELACKARPVGRLSYAMEREEGLRRDILHCFDIDLPETFEPRPGDGEVSSFELWPLSRALERVRDTDDFKFNVNLVMIDLFLREGLIAEAAAREIRDALDAGKT